MFLKSNRVIETDDRITAILAHLRRGVVGIYAQKKLNKIGTISLKKSKRHSAIN